MFSELKTSDRSDLNCHPLSHVVDQKNDWSIYHSGSVRIDRVNRRIGVSLHDDDISLNQRTRELARIKYLPSIPDYSLARVNTYLIEAEDLYLSGQLVKAGVNLSEGFIPGEAAIAMAQHYAATENLLDMYDLLIKLVYSKYAEPILSWLHRRGYKEEAETVRLAADWILTWSAASDEAAHWSGVFYVAQLLSNVRQRLENSFAGSSESGASDEKESKPEPSDSTSDEFAKFRPDVEVKRTLAGLKRWRSGIGSLEHVPWGQLRFTHRAFTQCIKRQPVARKVINSEEGTYLRQVWRVGTDRMVFGNIAKRLGGSVLIDVSGSMELSHEAIMQIVEHAPAASIAIYGGYRDDGEVVEIVRNERSIKPDQMYAGSGYNVVDGPALEQWLAKQPKPRFWVSDGNVTGINDETSKHLVDYTEELCCKHSIIRVHNVRAALEAFYRIKRNGHMEHPVLRRRRARTAGLYV